MTMIPVIAFCASLNMSYPWEQMMFCKNPVAYSAPSWRMSQKVNKPKVIIKPVVHKPKPIAKPPGTTITINNSVNIRGSLP